MIERTNTSQFQLLPEGHYVFTILEKPEKFRAGNTTYRKWKVNAISEEIGVNKTENILLFPWESEDWLLALGGKKEKSEVVWDDDQVAGKRVEADLAHVAYKDKDGNDKMKVALTNCSEPAPF